MSQRTSDAGREFIAVQEGERRYAYNDSQDNATFGIGHLLHEGPVTFWDQMAWGTKALPRQHEIVMAVFDRDVQKYEAAVREAIGRDVIQPAFDACVSLCINIGAGGFAKSSVAANLRDHKWQAAADAFLLWDNPPELRPRRERERDLFLHGKYR